MPTLESAYSDSLALVTDAAKSNTSIPANLRSYGILPSSVDTEIDFQRWNKLYPYALVIAEQSEGKLYFERSRFILPIPPEQLSIQTPYAIQVSKTLKGVVEEHNADPFRIIAFTGTTGVLPLRANKTTTQGQRILGGTVNAIQNTASSASALFGGSMSPVFDDDTIKGSGYGQFRLLELFLTAYVRAKKENNANIRLLFVPFKEQKAYVVTPIVFNMRREAGRALKYRYDLQLKAWDVFPSRQLISIGVLSTKNSLNFIDQSLNKYKEKLTQARKVIAGAVSVVRNARAAVNSALDIMRETSLFLSEAMGLGASIIDLPYQIVADCKAAFIDSWEDLAPDYEDLKSKYRVALYDLDDLANGHVIKRRPSVIDDYFANPTTAEASEFLGNADTTKLKLPKSLQDRIDAERERVTGLTSEDFARMRDTMRANIVQITDALGASNATFDSTYRNVHTAVTRTLGDGDWDVLFALNDALTSLNALAQQETAFPTTMEYILGFAEKTGTPFSLTESKFAVPFPYDTTLEQLARQYLGDPDRWIEIAALNGLREPYIDEVGFSQFLLVNGVNNTVTVPSNSNLVIGQPIWIQSINKKREKRHIVNIAVLGPGNVILTLDGESDLDKYRVADSAYIHTFLPDTVNSSQLIYIPSTDPSLDLADLSQIPGIDPYDPMLGIGGVDLMLKSDGDLAITPDGDCRFAYGMNAFIQHTRTALSTPRGSLIRHQDFGLPIKVGMSVSDLSLPDLKLALADMFTSDPAFNGIVNVSIVQNAATLNIGLNLEVSGLKQPIPVSFTVAR